MTLRLIRVGGVETTQIQQRERTEVDAPGSLKKLLEGSGTRHWEIAVDENLLYILHQDISLLDG